MVRAKTLPFDSFANATPGQIIWVFLNQLIDSDDDRARVHLECLEKYDTEYCPICNKPTNRKESYSHLPQEIQEQIYKPGEDVVRGGLHEDISEKRKKLLQLSQFAQTDERIVAVDFDDIPSEGEDSSINGN